MTKRAIWTLAILVVVLVAVVTLGILGIKHQGRTLSEVIPSERPTVIPSERPKDATAGVIGPSIPRQRLYKVEAISFHAVDESGADWWGSDEIYANWTDPKSGYVSVTRTYEGVDTGETRLFTPRDQQCILPVNRVPSPWFTPEGTKACSGGVPGPFYFEVALFEDDRFILNFCPGSRSPGFIVASCSDDDLIDQKRVSFTTEELEAAMPHVGDTFLETIAIRNFCGVPESEAGDAVYGCATTGPDYRFTYRITRLPDEDLPIHP